jgi:hypothetical protein
MEDISIQPLLIFILIVFILGLIEPILGAILSFFLVCGFVLKAFDDSPLGSPLDISSTEFFFSVLFSIGFSVLTFKFFKHLSSLRKKHTTKEGNSFKPSIPIIKAPSTTTPKKPIASINLVENTHESDFEYEDYYDGHTENTWNRIGLTIEEKHRFYSRNYYTFEETEPKGYSKYAWLTPNQRKVKILGDALVNRTNSKRLSKEILVGQYSFKEETAKYAVGYEGYHDW